MNSRPEREALRASAFLLLERLFTALGGEADDDERYLPFEQADTVAAQPRASYCVKNPPLKMGVKQPHWQQSTNVCREAIV
jgi:hypothetical protein